MRALTLAQAASCENATTLRCRCRCSGLAHGRQTHFIFQELPESDPHHVPAKTEPTAADPPAQEQRAQ